MLELQDRMEDMWLLDHACGHDEEQWIPTFLLQSEAAVRVESTPIGGDELVLLMRYISLLGMEYVHLCEDKGVSLTSIEPSYLHRMIGMYGSDVLEPLYYAHVPLTRLGSKALMGLWHMEGERILPLLHAAGLWGAGLETSDLAVGDLVEPMRQYGAASVLSVARIVGLDVAGMDGQSLYEMLCVAGPEGVEPLRKLGARFSQLSQEHQAALGVRYGTDFSLACGATASDRVTRDAGRWEALLMQEKDPVVERFVREAVEVPGFSPWDSYRLLMLPNIEHPLYWCQAMEASQEMDGWMMLEVLEQHGKVLLPCFEALAQQIPSLQGLGFARVIELHGLAQAIELASIVGVKDIAFYTLYRAIFLQDAASIISLKSHNIHITYNDFISLSVLSSLLEKDPSLVALCLRMDVPGWVVAYGLAFRKAYGTIQHYATSMDADGVPLWYYLVQHHLPYDIRNYFNQLHEVSHPVLPSGYGAVFDKKHSYFSSESPKGTLLLMMGHDHRQALHLRIADSYQRKGYEVLLIDDQYSTFEESGLHLSYVPETMRQVWERGVDLVWMEMHGRLDSQHTHAVLVGMAQQWRPSVEYIVPILQRAFKQGKPCKLVWSSCYGSKAIKPILQALPVASEILALSRAAEPGKYGDHNMHAILSVRLKAAVDAYQGEEAGTLLDMKTIALLATSVGATPSYAIHTTQGEIYTRLCYERVPYDRVTHSLELLDAFGKQLCGHSNLPCVTVLHDKLLHHHPWAERSFACYQLLFGSAR